MTAAAPAAAGLATLRAAVAAASARLAEAGIATARLDARLLASHMLEVDGAALLTEGGRVLSATEAGRLAAVVARRAAGEPVSRILGRREFWSLDFLVTPAVLDPRPDSETLVSAALSRLSDRQRAWRVLDLGAGSGCLLLALLSELPAARGVGVERSPAAVEIAARNADRLGMAGRCTMMEADFADAPDGPFDIVLSNPPYIPSAEIAGLSREVREHDPRGALDGGPDGLAAYRRIASLLASRLAPGGFAALEVGGRDQAQAVTSLLEENGLCVAAIEPDLAGRPRCILAVEMAVFRGSPPV